MEGEAAEGGKGRVEEEGLGELVDWAKGKGRRNRSLGRVCCWVDYCTSHQ